MRKPTETQARRAAERLGLNLDAATPEAVTAAFRAAVRKAHPDAGGDAETAPDTVLLLTVAKSTLIEWLKQSQDNHCTRCKGAGRIRANAFGGVVPCPSCS